MPSQVDADDLLFGIGEDAVPPELTAHPAVLHPAPGKTGVEAAHPFTQTVPASTSSARRWAAVTSRVHMLAVNP